MYDNCMYCCEVYVTLLDEQSRAEDRVHWVSPIMAYISGFKQDIENWLRSASTDNMPAKEQLKVRQQSDDSSRGSSRKSSIATTVNSARFKEEQRIAELKVKADNLQKKRELEQAKLSLEIFRA